MDNYILLIVGLLLFLHFSSPKEKFSLRNLQRRDLDPSFVRTNGPSNDNVYHCQSLCADNRRGVRWWWQNQDRSFADCYLDCMKNPK